MEQAAQDFVAHKVTGRASKAELLKAGETWARSYRSPGRLGQPCQVQQPQHLGARPRMQMGRGGDRCKRWGVRYLQLGTAFLQGLDRQLEGNDVVVEASAHLQDLELWAAVAL